MIKLTDYEKRMLDGEMGLFKKKAMEFNMRYAHVLGALEMCTVSRATLFLGAQRYLDCYRPDEDYCKIFSEFYLCSDETVAFGRMDEACKAQTCEGACDFTDYRRTHLTKAYHERNLSYIKATLEAGVSIVDTCAPYYVGWVPVMGEHFVSTESSNVVMSNSLFGARGNSDGVEAAVCAAITGRTPLWGMHVKKNRYADCLVRLQCKTETPYDWDLVGFTVGRLLPKLAKPVLVGNFKRPDVHMLRQAFSAIAVTSAAEICHVLGVTPEAQTLAMATGYKKNVRQITVTQGDCNESLKMICDDGSGPVDYVSVGCPHLALDELKAIADYMRGKKVRSGVELLVWTSYATKEMANVNGYTRVIENTGAYLLTGSCPVVMREQSHCHATGMVMNGAKQAYCIKNQTDKKVYFGNLFQSIDAAIAGYWRPQNGCN